MRSAVFWVRAHCSVPQTEHGPVDGLLHVFSCSSVALREGAACGWCDSAVASSSVVMFPPTAVFPAVVLPSVGRR